MDILQTNVYLYKHPKAYLEVGSDFYWVKFEGEGSRLVLHCFDDRALAERLVAALNFDPEVQEEVPVHLCRRCEAEEIEIDQLYCDDCSRDAAEQDRFHGDRI